MQSGTQEWSETFFDKMTLNELGLCVQLRHEDGSTCLKPHCGLTDMIIIHTNRIHEVLVNYCDCH